MTDWFHRTVIDPGRLPLFLFLVAFILTFLFIRFSVRMIRAEVSWWPGNVTPGGLHLHHEFFGVIMMALSGFGLIAVARYDAPIADAVLASIFGIGCALVLDEFALILHLRDVYWEEEGRSSVDAVFVAIAIGGLFLVGLRPLDISAAVGDWQHTADPSERIGVVIGVAVNVLLAVITLAKGKLWTGLVGMFLPFLLLFGAIRVARPASPWSRWFYGSREAKYEKAVAREVRYREPLIRWKIVVQEALAGRFGVPDKPPALPPQLPASDTTAPKAVAPNAIATAIRWRRTRRALHVAPTWRLPAVLIVLAIITAILCITLDESVGLDVDSGTLAAVLGVIAGAMATLTGLVFTAVTLAMQFGASQISVRVIPRLQREPTMRWSIGFFLATFVFSVMVAMDLALSEPEDATPGISTAIAAVLTVVSAFLFVALVAKVGTVLNSAQLLRWIAADGRGAIRREYPDVHDVPTASPLEESAESPDEHDESDEQPRTVIPLRETASRGRVLLAVNIPRLQALAVRWDVRFELLVAVGDYVPHHVGVIAVTGPGQDRVAIPKVLRCLFFGDTHQPSVSPSAALQSISDIALKAISSAGNDPSSVVLALDHTEDLLLMLAPRVRADVVGRQATLVDGYRRTWGDYVAIGTDEIRRHSRNQAQVQRRLRALYGTLLEQCSYDQQPPIVERIQALDEQIETEWTVPLDRRLASAPDRQGSGSERGSTLA
ncbi:DUF2254 domain-containing protein [Gordonia sp. NB41Y]|uniref:DUF2254 domain-containing protein n=1 Tax=Gordonia sp. NB41Y TaxID=875808 RepID=UPI0002BE4E6D|nr:DUF2254 domain-containing protein [Gordonia sp. NB41Y]EMP14760.1 membrane protein [Gordonia sp. NB41Y]WLP92807.1 DUF2254 domain-containing protein [Gordonia sp. NB41Y]